MPRRARGATLVEVLIALLVISIGLLGMARLSAASIGHTKSSQVRLTAQTLVRNHAERVRLNLYGYDLGAYDQTLTATIPDAIAPDPDADDQTGAMNVASQDQRDFMRALDRALPAARAVVVSRASADHRDLDVWVLWPDVAMEADDRLTDATTDACPADLTEAQRDGNSCLHFRVGL